jgi:hypothetical protein
MTKKKHIVAARGGNIDENDESPDGLENMLIAMSKNPIEMAKTKPMIITNRAAQYVLSFCFAV